MSRIILLIIGIMFIFVGGFNYLIDTVKGRVKPNRVSWLLWGVIPIIIFLAEHSKGVGLISFLTLAIGFTPVAVFVATYFNKESVWRLTKFDFACGALSIIGIILWYFSRDGNTAIFFSILADIFVSAPTYRKSFTNPETESYKVYFLSAIGTGIALLATEVWNFENIIFPVYVFLGCVLFTVLIKFKIGKKLSYKNSINH